MIDYNYGDNGEVFRVEYSKQQGLFHICEQNEKLARNKSWKIIQNKVSLETAFKITEMLEEDEGW